jgi:hypothetical protein
LRGHSARKCRTSGISTSPRNRAIRVCFLTVLGDRDPFAAKVATKHVGMYWVGKTPNHVFPHSRLSRQLVRSIGHFTRAAKLVHMVEHGTHRARRNTDHNTVRKIAADPQHTACHWSDAPLPGSRAPAACLEPMVQFELFHDFIDSEDDDREPQCVPDSLCLEMCGEKMALTISGWGKIFHAPDSQRLLGNLRGLEFLLSPVMKYVGDQIGYGVLLPRRR